MTLFAKTKFLIGLLLALSSLSVITHAQMPVCNKLYWDTYDTLLHVYDPALPLSATNPTINSILLPADHSGLAISKPLDGSSTGLVFYTVVDGTYRYYNGTAWHNTGHSASSANLAAGGGKIYNLDGATGKVYLYNGQTEVLIATLPPFMQPYDLIADCAGNWYALNTSNGQPDAFFRKYDSTGILLRSWKIVNPGNRKANGAFGIIGRTLYLDNSFPGGVAKGLIGDTTVTIDTALVRPYPLFYANDFGTCAESIDLLPSISIQASRLRVCQGQQVTFTSSIYEGGTNPQYQWQVNGINQGSNSSTFTYIPANSDIVTCKLLSNVTCVSTNNVISNNIQITVDTPTLLPAVSISNTANGFCSGIPVTFAATVANSTINSFQWRINGVIVGSNSSYFTSAGLSDGDSVTVTVVSGDICFLSTPVTSAKLVVHYAPSIIPGININTIPPNRYCSGTPITFISNHVGGGMAPTYRWYRNGLPIPGITSQNYTATALSDGDTISVALYSSEACPVTQPTLSNKMGVNVLPVLHAQVQITSNPTGNFIIGQPVLFTAAAINGGNSPTYYWMINGIVVPGTGNTFTANNLREGDMVQVKLESSEPCTQWPVVYSNSITVRYGTQVVSVGNTTLTLYPNPVSDYLFINSAKMPVNASFYLFDAAGRSVHVQQLVNVQETIDLRRLAPGLYSYNLIIDGSVYRSRIVKR